ncbi:hypothetical protein ACQB60_02295 [Actinomycetota bacterium Odt1-20B]
MTFTRRVSTHVCALAVGAAVLTPLVGTGSAQASAGDTATAGAAEKAAVAAEAGGFHSKKGKLTCRKKGETAWIWDSAAGASRVSWKPKGGHLVSRVWRHTPDGVSTRTIPTWRKNVTWKVTSHYGNGKNLSKVYGYCSKTGWRVGKKSSGLGQKKTGVKRCPAGKTVYISSGGIGNIVHKFKPVGGGSVRTHAFGGSQQILVTDRATPTELRAVKYSAQAYNIKHAVPNAKIGRVELKCISKY